MNTAARFLPAVLALALGFSIRVGEANAQAMVGYGHGVAKAAGAGAAVGAGAGGALTGLGNPLASATERRGGSAKQNATVQRQTMPVRRGSVTGDVPHQGFGSPAPLPLIGGVQVSGATAQNWQPILLEPSQNLAVISASWGGLSAEGSKHPAGAVSSEELPDENADQTAEEAKENLPNVLRSTGPGGASAGKAVLQSDAVAPGSLPAGVAVGASVEELLEKLGRPYLSFRGVAGDGYTDQYVFQLPDGGHLVAYVLNGVVAHLAFG